MAPYSALEITVQFHNPSLLSARETARSSETDGVFQLVESTVPRRIECRGSADSWDAVCVFSV
jgi:hypothetical protein